MTVEQMTLTKEKKSDIDRPFETTARAGEQLSQPAPIRTRTTSSADSQLFMVRLWPEAIGDDAVGQGLTRRAFAANSATQIN